MVMSANETETFVRSNQVFQVPEDGVYMPVARYQRYRRAVADKIQEEEQTNGTNY
jgi:hypothetical protein